MNEGPVIGDGGFVFALEKRGYVKAGPWTPEATVEHPEAGECKVYSQINDKLLQNVSHMRRIRQSFYLDTDTHVGGR